MTIEVSGIAPAAQRTLAVWHDVFVSRDCDRMRPLLAETVVLHSPVVRSPIVGRAACLLVLCTVSSIFQGFRYHRTYVGDSQEVALEFSAAIDSWDLKGIDLMHFNDDGEIAEFEVLIRPLRALSALGEEIGRRIGPQLMQLKRGDPVR